MLSTHASITGLAKLLNEQAIFNDSTQLVKIDCTILDTFRLQKFIRSFFLPGMN